MRIGIDVGGTNTDAVLMDGMRVVAWHKTPTTPEVSGGIRTALERVLGPPGRPRPQVGAVMIGTTHFTNAVIERRRLQPVGIVRLGLPAGAALPPLVGWPHDLRRVVEGCVRMLGGGHEMDGREIAPLDERGVAEAAREFRRRELGTIAVTSIFSPVNAAMERRACDIILENHPAARVTLSHTIGRIGLIQRENATILNASLIRLAGDIVASFEAAMAAAGVSAPFFVSQNDGTLMSAASVAAYPVLTFASGPTNSMRGAAFLTGMEHALVADVGGTTTDVGMLVKGFPREATQSVDIGGVPTNFRMPDVLSIGIGGGSIVRLGDAASVGPESVGFRLTEMAQCFGGEVLTASDIAVASGCTAMGDPGRLRHLDQLQVERALKTIHQRIAAAVDAMKTSAAEVPLVLVGGGAVLICRDLPGISRIIRPEHAGVANAIGASIAQVSGEVDRVCSFEVQGREAALEEACSLARQRTIAAGASAQSVRLIEVEEIPLAYVPGGSVRVRVRAVGDLQALG